MQNTYINPRSYSQAIFYLLVTLFILFIFVSSCGDSESATNSGWEQVPEIMKRIVPPAYPAKDFYITDYNALGDGTTDCTEAFKQAINACAEAGGGRVGSCSCCCR